MRFSLMPTAYPKFSRKSLFSAALLPARSVPQHIRLDRKQFNRTRPILAASTLSTRTGCRRAGYSQAPSPLSQHRCIFERIRRNPPLCPLPSAIITMLVSCPRSLFAASRFAASAMKEDVPERELCLPRLQHPPKVQYLRIFFP